MKAMNIYKLIDEDTLECLITFNSSLTINAIQKLARIAARRAEHDPVYSKRYIFQELLNARDSTSENIPTWTVRI